MERRQLARWLESEHQKRSWREISQDFTSGTVPPGTLCRIAKSNGQYVPNKWRAYFGISAHKASGNKPKRLADLPAKVLKEMFEQRTEM